MNSELVYVGLKGKCERWCRHKCVGSRGPLAHADLWSDMWSQWLLLGDSASIQWVPLHVEVEGNEKTEQQAAKGAKISQSKVVQHKMVAHIWAEPMFCQKHKFCIPVQVCFYFIWVELFMDRPETFHTVTECRLY